jgi:hypothetical protein
MNSPAVGAEGSIRRSRPARKRSGCWAISALGAGIGCNRRRIPPQPRPITSSFDLPLLGTPAEDLTRRARRWPCGDRPAPRGANRTTADEPVLFKHPPFERLAARLARAGPWGQ